MSDPPPARPDRGQLADWAKTHPGQVLSVVGILFIGVKLLAVSRFQPTTALAIASAAGPADVLLAMLVLGYPVLLTVVGLAGFAHFVDVLNREEPGRAGRAVASLAICLVALALVDLNLIVLLAVASFQPLGGLAGEWASAQSQGGSRLTPGAELYVRHLPRPAPLSGADDPDGPEPQVDEVREPNAAWSRLVKLLGLGWHSILWVAPLVAFVILSLSPRVWVPPEIVALDTGEEVVGYVMGNDGDWTTLLREKGRSIARVKSEAIEGRVVCRLRPGFAAQSVVQLVLGEETAPRCPHR